jgi:diguanylate cyclase (GGDEF)-like protein
MTSELAPTRFDRDILLETIVAITEQRDQHSLELSLFASLREMLQPACGFFLDLPASGPARTVLPSRGEDVALPDSVITQAREMSELDFLQVPTEGMVYMLAVMEASKDGGRRVLLVGMAQWSELSERLLVGMVRVYQNFMKLMSDSEKDTLTGLHNRRKLESHLAARLTARLHERRAGDAGGEGKGKGEAGKGEYLAVLDLDKFKRINDTWGHLIGDEVLLTFANILRASLRDNDRSFRYGGEEFIVVLGDVSPEQAAMVLERLRGNVERHAFPQVGQVTVSVGYTLIDGQDLPTRIIEEADKALYYAKEHGRNQVRDYRALRDQGAVEDNRHDGSVELF